ncbi:hypothetical protein, partial [Blastococcus sp. CCUG 61487]|uniref:hypothetical protein n=1 Tax=Blastococcus sp. CCUG 61487 TaxID=1840703 RepID=UPI0032E50DF1
RPRAVRWVLAQAAARAGSRALSLRDEVGGFVLLPASFPVQQLTQRAAPPDLAAPVMGVAVAASPGAVPAAAARADRISAVAGRPGVHQLADVLLEYHLTHPVDSASELAGVLDPLARHPE